MWEVSNKNGFFSPFAYQSGEFGVYVSPILAAVLKRDRAIVAMGLAGVATLAWIYLIYMDWGMRHMDVGMNMVIMPAMRHWTAWDLALVFLMWAVMMVAMMVPAASPVILLFAEIIGVAKSTKARSYRPDSSCWVI
jgi:predicted metal-binding membrane protein